MTDVRGLSIDREPARIPEPRRRLGMRVLLPVALIGAVAGAILFAARDLIGPAPLVRVEPVVAAPASTGGGLGTITVTAPGWIAPDPYPIRVVAMTEGILAEVLALDGDRVEAGQVVARLVPDDARIARTRALAQLDGRAAARPSLEAERGTLPAAIVAAEAAIEATRQELALKEPLADAGSLSRAEIGQLRARLRAEEAALVTARARGPALDARLAEADAEVAIARADVAAAELRLARTEVRAPVGGVVLQRVATPGTPVGRPGTPARPDVLELYDPTRLLVRADVPFADAARIAVGQHAVISVEALPNRTFAGRVARAVQEADVAKNTVSFQVVLEETAEVLRPDMIARVRFQAAAPPTGQQTGRSVLFMPIEAVREGRALAVVDVEGGRGRIETRTLELGGEHDGFVEVRAGLELGDRVVVDGPDDLSDGQRVTVGGLGGDR